VRPDRAATDAELAGAARAGSRDAFALLVDGHATRLYRFLRMRSRTPDDADDLLQETFLLCWRKREQLDPARPLAPWLFKLAANVAASSARRRRPAGGLPDDLTHELTHELTGGVDPAQSVARQDDDRNLWDVVHRTLPPAARTALWLFYAEDQPAAAIAEILGKSEGAVRVLLCRARARLATALGPPAAPIAIPVESP
jgi:RNA polymerase sigma-70 factor (ECF subfamily)